MIYNLFRVVRSHRCFIPALLIIVSSLPASAAPYAFKKIADSSGPFSRFAAPAINNLGDVAFWALSDTGQERILLRHNGFTLIADTSGQFNTFAPPPHFITTLPYISLNDDGAVAHYASLDSGEIGVFSSNGAQSTLIATITALYHGIFPPVPVINNTGVVTFAGFDAPEKIYVGNGSFLTTLLETSGLSFPYPDINDSGVVAFSGEYASDVFTGTHPADLALAIDDTGPFQMFFASSINNAGVIAFPALLDTNVRGIYTLHNGVVTTIAENDGPYSDFNLFADINSSGSLAFAANLDSGGRGIFTGPDPLTDKVIAIGDPLFGSTLARFDITRSLNDPGDIAFYYKLANGVSGIAVAHPIPEPASAVPLLLAAFGFAFRRRLPTPH